MRITYKKGLPCRRVRSCAVPGSAAVRRKMRGTGNQSLSISRAPSLTAPQPLLRSSSTSIPRDSTRSQNQTLPGYRAKKGKSPAKVSAQAIFTLLGTCVTILFVYLHLWVSPRNFAASSKTSYTLANKSARDALGDGASGASGVTVWPQVPSQYMGGTDKFTPSRDGEMLSSWDPKMGLEIDAWDPRTHDPRNKPDWSVSTSSSHHSITESLHNLLIEY